MDDSGKTRPLPDDAAGSERGRRRIGTVVHDERGNASVKWRDAPEDYQRPVLELEREQGATAASEEGCDPYAQRGAGTTVRTRPADAPRPARTDLRKLSEHIKKMRELEARKRAESEQD